MIFGSHYRVRVGVVAAVAIAALIGALSDPMPTEGTLEDAVEALGGGSGFPSVVDGSFNWVWPGRVAKGGALEWHPAVFAARPPEGGLRDLYAADLMVTSDGMPRRMRRAVNLSQTADGDERVIAADGRGQVAFAAEVDGSFDSFSTIDFGGEPAALTRDWSGWWKLANEITNLQRTGRPGGLHWRTYILREPVATLALEYGAKDGALSVRGDDVFAVVERGKGIASRDLVVQEMVKGRPAPLAWAVDTVRAVPWVGRRKIEWLEKVWFDFSDWLARTRYGLVGEGDEAIDEYVPQTAASGVETAGLPGWPPADIAPLLKDPKPGEGKWVPVDDPLHSPDAGPIALFYRAFIRTDSQRPFARVHITAWDPSRVELRMVAGVREPVSTTGVKGTGEIPRERGGIDHVGRLVGAFNGAFQALHGEWGMVIDRKILLPPRAYGATVAVLEDGRVAMGTWPEPVGEIPPDMVDIRQNVHPLVEGGVLNPYKRQWWGGVPAGVEERVATTRSGMCLTFGGKMAYFWGEHLSPESLGAAMIAARCDFGIHLDMNSGHCGFEFYRVDEAGRQPAAQSSPDPKSQAEGLVPGRPDLFFRARKMVRDMGHMRFPRYINRDPRDFFYLLLRKSMVDDEGPLLEDGSRASWRAVGAVEGFPAHMMAVDFPGGVRVLKLDHAQVSFYVEDEAPEDVVAAIPFATSQGGIAAGLMVDGVEVASLAPVAPGLELQDGAAAFSESAIEGRAGTLIQGVWPSAARQMDIRNAVGFHRDGYLLLASGRKMAPLADALERCGADRVFALISPGGKDGDFVRWLVARRSGRAAWKRIFEDVEPVPPEVWREVFRKRGKLLDHGEE